MEERYLKSKPVIAFIASYTQSLMNFRLQLMIDFVRLGYDVHALGPADQATWQPQFHKYNIYYHQIEIKRTGINPIADLRTLISIRETIARIKPKLLFLYGAKPIVYGSIVGKQRGMKIFILVAGLGSILRGKSLKSFIIKPILKSQYRTAFRNSAKVFVQNPDDATTLTDGGYVCADKLVVINGSGVDLKYYAAVPLPDEPAFLFVGRLLKDKGILEYLEACKALKSISPNTRCMLVGSYDSNPSSIKKKDLVPYISDNIVEFYGHQSDVRPFISQCSTLVLPSYHEGTPRSVLEAMSMGRSIITTDAPGCRETVKEGYNGYLVKVKNVSEIVDRMYRIVSDYPKSRLMGERSLSIARDKYDIDKVNQSIILSMGLANAGCTLIGDVK